MRQVTINHQGHRRVLMVQSGTAGIASVLMADASKDAGLAQDAATHAQTAQVAAESAKDGAVQAKNDTLAALAPVEAELNRIEDINKSVAVWSEGTFRSMKARATDTFCILDGKGADPTGINDSTAAIRQAIQSGLRVEIPKGTFVWDASVDDLGMVITTHGQKIFGHGCGSTTGDITRWFNEFRPVSRILMVGDGRKIERTRREFRANASDPTDPQMSAALTVAADGVSLENWALDLQCDYTDMSRSNLGSDWDIGVHNMCRIGYHEQNFAVYGYFRKYGRLQDNTSLNKSIVIPDYTVPDRQSRGTDDCTYINSKGRAANIGLAILGPKRGPAGAQYYDTAQGLVSDNRGSYGSSDTTIFASKIFAGGHHSGWRRHQPRADRNHLLEPEDAPACFYIDGWANNFSQVNQGIRFAGRNRFSTVEAFHIRLGRCNQVAIEGWWDYEGYSNPDSSPTLDYGSVTAQPDTQNVTLLPACNSNPKPEYFGSQFSTWDNLAPDNGNAQLRRINVTEIRQRTDGSSANDLQIQKSSAGTITIVDETKGGVWRWYASGNFGPSEDNTYNIGSSGNRVGQAFARLFRPGDGSATWTAGSGAPNASATAGSLYGRTDGAVDTSLYQKVGTSTSGYNALQAIASGTTANRPTVTTAGFRYFDTTLGKPVWWKGSGWVDATGATV